jgi:hypothetical protein
MRKCAQHFRPDEPGNRINRVRFNQVLLYFSVSVIHRIDMPYFITIDMSRFISGKISESDEGIARGPLRALPIHFSPSDSELP